MINTLKSLLKIHSPTFHENLCVDFLKNWMNENIPFTTLTESENSLIFESEIQPEKKTIAFVGHSDVVPDEFPVEEKQGKIYGSGASDMKGALACYMVFLKDYFQELNAKFNIKLIIYAREEGTPLKDNGLFELFQSHPKKLQSIDLAIVGEPTDNTIQIGCVGSIHANVTVTGESCHSARPWNGDNALYKALPLIQYFSELEPEKKTIFGVDFFDVLQITESQSEKGRTSLPGNWHCNINYRFAPCYSMEEAENKLLKMVEALNIDGLKITIADSAPAGSVIESELFSEIVKTFGSKIQAKQAWTDIAQLSAHNIPAFNFGPGLTSQAHKNDEFITIKYLEEYMLALKKLLY